MVYVAWWSPDDCHWLVIAPIGVVVDRCPTREQAAAACAALNERGRMGLEIEDEGERDGRGDA